MNKVIIHLRAFRLLSGKNRIPGNVIKGSNDIILKEANKPKLSPRYPVITEAKVVVKKERAISNEEIVPLYLGTSS